MNVNCLNHLKQAFKVNLKQLRENKGYSQVHMAQSLNVARQTYLDIESGKVSPRLSMVEAICNTLGCELTDLIYSMQYTKAKQYQQLQQTKVVVNGVEYAPIQPTDNEL